MHAARAYIGMNVISAFIRQAPKANPWLGPTRGHGHRTRSTFQIARPAWLRTLGSVLPVVILVCVGVLF